MCVTVRGTLTVPLFLRYDSCAWDVPRETKEFFVAIKDVAKVTPEQLTDIVDALRFYEKSVQRAEKAATDGVIADAYSKKKFRLMALANKLQTGELELG